MFRVSTMGLVLIVSVLVLLILRDIDVNMVNHTLIINYHASEDIIFSYGIEMISKFIIWYS